MNKVSGCRGEAVTESDSVTGGVGSGHTIKIKVSHGSSHHDITVPSQSTFGHLKRVISEEIGLDPKDYQLLFRGKEKEDEEYLHVAGVRENSKLLLMEAKDKDKKLEEAKERIESSRGYKEVAEIRAEDDKLEEKVTALTTKWNGVDSVTEKDLFYTTEMLMRQLLKLDGIDAEGEAKVLRKMEVRRVQSLVERLDHLKTMNSNPSSSSIFVEAIQTEKSASSLPSSTTVTNDWEVFEADGGSSDAPSKVPTSTTVTQNWEVFD